MAVLDPPLRSRRSPCWARLRPTGAAAWAITAVVWLLVAGWGPAPKARAQDLEYAVKANYLYKFTPFVAWPQGAFASPTAPFTICIIGRDPFGSALDDAIRGKQVGDRPIQVRRLPTATAGMSCHLLFAARSATQPVSEITRLVSGRPVLTIADDAAPGDGAMISFVLQGGHVRFDINPQAAAESGIVISSKLLGLAVSQRGGPR